MSFRPLFQPIKCQKLFHEESEEIKENVCTFTIHLNFKARDSAEDGIAVISC